MQKEEDIASADHAVGSPRRGDREPSAFSESALPMLFGGYELLAEIGRGGMGVVYRARQLAINRVVALKMLLHGRFSEAAFVERFHIEAEAAAHLDHPNIVPIYEVGQHEGQPYYSMKLIEGRSLDRVNAECRTQKAEYRRQSAEWLRRCAELVATIARAVHYAHQHGVLHRDIKPHNILLDAEGQPHLTDFGLAKLLNQESGLTLSAAVIGSPGFMAPEQAAGKTRQVTTAADVYGLGAVLYALLAGKAVFHADTPLETVRLVIEQEPVRPRLVNPAVDRDLETICLKCLQKEPAKRYPSAQALAEDLECWLRAEPIQARRVAPFERVWLWCRRNPRLASAMGVALLSLLIGLAGVLWQWRRAERQRRQAESNELLARQSAYASDINLAQRALEANDVRLALSLLDKHRPERKAESRKRKTEILLLGGADSAPRPSPFDPRPSIDLRGWEWRYLWKLCQADESAHLQPNSGAVGAMAISPDGKVMAVQTGSKKVALWDLTTKQQIAELSVSAPISLLALSGMGSRLATSARNAQGDPRVEIWDTNEPAPRATFRPPVPLLSLALSPDGTLLATFDRDGGIVVKEWVSDRTLTNFAVRYPRHRTGRLTFSPDGSRLAIGEDYGRISLLDWRTGTVVAMTHETPGGDPVKALAFSPTTPALVAGYGGAGGTIRLWDARSGAPLGQLTSHTGVPAALAFTPDGRFVASASSDRTIRVWRVADQTEMCHFRGHAGEGRFLAFLPDGKTLVSGCDVSTACFWDVTATNRSPAHASMVISLGPGLQGTNEPESFLSGPRSATTVRRFGFTFAPDGNSLITTDPYGVLGVWDTRALRKTEALAELGSNYWGVALSPNSRWLAAGDGSGRVNTWDWKHRQPVQSLAFPFQWFGRLQFSRSSRFLWAWTMFNDRTTRFGIWRTEDWREVRLPGGLVEGLWSADLSPDDRLLATGYPDGRVKVWDFPSGQPVTTFTHHKGSVAAVVFSPDGRKLASASYDSTVRLWDVAARRELASPLRGHSVWVWEAAFSPDGRCLATGGSSAQEAVKLWDLATRRELLSLQAEGELFFHIAFSQDGSSLMATSFAGLAHLWRAPSWAEIEAAERKQGVP